MTPERFNLASSIEGRTALVTGGSSGIGEACVEAFREAGANVALTYSRGENSARAIQERLGGEDHISIHKLDLTSAESVRGLSGEVAQRWPDWLSRGIFVHNAAVGTATVKHYAEDPAEQIAALYQINTVAAHQLIADVVAKMEAVEGDEVRHIIGISSVGSRLAIFPDFNVADGASKAALDYIVRHMAAARVMDPRFNMNVVCPGATDTPMLRESFIDGLGNARAEFEKTHLPAQRFITPKQIADAVMFLCSEQARMIRGATIPVTGGLELRPGLLTE